MLRGNPAQIWNCCYRSVILDLRFEVDGCNQNTFLIVTQMLPVIAVLAFHYFLQLVPNNETVFLAQGNAQLLLAVKSIITGMLQGQGMSTRQLQQEILNLRRK